jgi:hypothetical protein
MQITNYTQQEEIKGKMEEAGNQHEQTGRAS